MLKEFYVLLGCSFVLVACASSDWGVASTGPNVNGGPVSVALKATTEGEIVVESEVSIPLAGNETLGVTWDIAYERTLVSMRQQPESSGFWLYVLWDLGDGVVHRKTYNSVNGFDITFGQEEWVERITYENGSVVVYVSFRKLAAIDSFLASDSTSTTRVNPQVIDTPVPICDPIFSPRLSVGGQASIIVFQVRVFTDASRSSELVEHKYFAEGRILEVRSGPVCNENLYWWYVYSPELGYGGWVPEADHENYYMAPR